MNAPEGLRDIHLPDAVSWWPLAIGWWVVIALIIVCIIALYFIYKKYNVKKASQPLPRPNWRPLVKQEFSAIKKQYQDNQDEHQLSVNLSELLRRTVVNEAPETVSGITGQKWLSYLDQHFGMQSDQSFISSAGKALLEAPYNKHYTFKDNEAKQLLTICKQAIHQSRKSPC